MTSSYGWGFGVSTIWWENEGVSLLWFDCGRQQKCHAAAPPPATVRRRMERNRQKLVGRDKGSLTEQQTEGTVTTTVQIRRINRTKHSAQQSRPPRPTLRPPEPRLSSCRPAPPPPKPSMMAHGMEYPALFGQVGSARLAVSLPGFQWKLTLSWPNPGHAPHFMLSVCLPALLPLFHTQVWVWWRLTQLDG